VHLLTADASETEVTWNRESNPLVGSPYAYDVTPDSDYSSNAKSSEYLSIVRPDGGRGTITISNTGALDTFVGSYFLELRAHHQGVTTTKRLTHVGFNCDITIGYDTTTPIVRYLSTNPATTQDLSISVASANCPALATYTATCTGQTGAQAWCDSFFALDLTTGVVTLTGDISDNVFG
jgi:hypothetical protein